VADLGPGGGGLFVLPYRQSARQPHRLSGLRSDWAPPDPRGAAVGAFSTSAKPCSSSFSIHSDTRVISIRDLVYFAARTAATPGSAFPRDAQGRLAGTRPRLRQFGVPPPAPRHRVTPSRWTRRFRRILYWRRAAGSSPRRRNRNHWQNVRRLAGPAQQIWIEPRSRPGTCYTLLADDAFYIARRQVEYAPPPTRRRPPKSQEPRRSFTRRRRQDPYLERWRKPLAGIRPAGFQGQATSDRGQHGRSSRNRVTSNTAIAGSVRCHMGSRQDHRCRPAMGGGLRQGERWAWLNPRFGAGWAGPPIGIGVAPHDSQICLYTHGFRPRFTPPPTAARSGTKRMTIPRRTALEPAAESTSPPVTESTFDPSTRPAHVHQLYRYRLWAAREGARKKGGWYSAPRNGSAARGVNDVLDGVRPAVAAACGP